MTCEAEQGLPWLYGNAKRYAAWKGGGMGKQLANDDSKK
jgi:hypothetical protein